MGRWQTQGQTLDSTDFNERLCLTIVVQMTARVHILHSSKFAFWFRHKIN